MKVLEDEERYNKAIFSDLVKREKDCGLTESEARYRNRVSCYLTLLAELRFKIDHYVK